ncbi:reverse transcriptase domain-containing protein [Listeria cornellensis]|uniref:Reverse transcriptase domain-containing protein n=1 Tax=Listeria cornellensis FSL F6-0969 TaxID=1265820 RepID=W7CF77_9LIST|nr:reverse transcriptase domain-containing protein [Listeria cornellensis]EUJ31438.1 hypothetical protein PCORN_05261 [Listeria cornellensis FSL F6-0969]
MVEFKSKKYLHFDNSMEYDDVKNYVENPKKIQMHSFFPLIQYVNSFDKYEQEDKTIERKERPIKTKSRTIMYASHLDSYIYTFYGRRLNALYNTCAIKNGIDDCAIAYRDNKSSKCNIDFAAELIHNICEMEESFIMVGDYKTFFDTLDHANLKTRMKETLVTDELDLDWYQIYKSVTKYRYIEKSLLNEKIGTDGEIKEFIKNRIRSRLENGVKERVKWSYFQTYKEVREFIEKNGVKYNQQKFGIPQGTPISAVFANVYMIDLDKKIQELVMNNHGIYRRYSDDFIIAIPKKSLATVEDFKFVQSEIIDLINESGLTLQADKTKVYEFCNKEIYDLEINKRASIDYLGFVFDGKNVLMRQKSPYKFYRKAYQLIEIAKNKSRAKGLKKTSI